MESNLETPYPHLPLPTDIVLARVVEKMTKSVAYVIEITEYEYTDLDFIVLSYHFLSGCVWTLTKDQID